MGDYPDELPTAVQTVAAFPFYRPGAGTPIMTIRLPLPVVGIG